MLWALTLLSALPLVFSRIPPLNDLLGHAGRYHIQINHLSSPALNTFWSFKWALMGNLGVDLLIMPLAALFGLERAIWIIAFILPPLMIWGMIRLARAVHSAVPPNALFAFPLAAAFPYQFGFVNFWLALALALHALATWVQMLRRGVSPAVQAISFLPIGFLLWLCHLYGWAIFAVMAGAVTLVHFGHWDWRKWHQLGLILAKRLWTVALPAALVLLWQQGTANDVLTTGFFRWGHKAQQLSQVLRDQNIWLDVGSVVVIGSVIAFGLISRNFRLDRGLGLAACIFLVLQVFLPIQLQGSAYADSRLWPITIALAVLSLRPVDRKAEQFRFGPLIAGLGAVLIVSRVVVGSAGFASYGRAYTSHLMAIEKIAPGSRVVALVGLNCPDQWRKSRIEHLPSLAILRKDVFTNTQWAISSGQLLNPRYARGTGWDRDPSQFVGHWNDCRLPMPARMAARASQIPRGLFDYLWVLDVDTVSLPRIPGTMQVFRDDRSALYRLDPPL